MSAVLASSAAQAADLLEVYQRAVQNDPLIREAEANRLASRESKPRAIGALLPQIEAAGSIGQSDSEGSQTFLTRSSLTDPNAPPIISTTDQETDADFTQYRLQLTQTVFRWDQWKALSQASSQVAQAEADYAAAQQDLMLRSAQRYFDVLAAEDTLQSVTTARDAISRQLEQANKRFEVGLIAITDVQEAKAAFDNANAVVIQSKRNLATAHELLRELTGDPFHDLSKLSESMPLTSVAIGSESTYRRASSTGTLALLTMEPFPPRLFMPRTAMPRRVSSGSTFFWKLRKCASITLSGICTADHSYGFSSIALWIDGSLWPVKPR